MEFGRLVSIRNVKLYSFRVIQNQELIIPIQFKNSEDAVFMCEKGVEVLNTPTKYHLTANFLYVCRQHAHPACFVFSRMLWTCWIPWKRGTLQKLFNFHRSIALCGPCAMAMGSTQKPFVKAVISFNNGQRP